MGMFDWIECRYPLPGNVPDWATAHPRFQTKDLDQTLETYVITPTGLLVGMPDYTGLINFYNDNIVSSSGPRIYTAEGEDAWSVSYCAVFVNGMLVSLSETENNRRPAVKRRRSEQKFTPEDAAALKQRREESLLGRRIYLLWGNETIGRYVVVIAENSTELICQHEDLRFETVPRWQRGNCFFDSEDEALRSRKASADAWELLRLEYEAEIASKRIEHGKEE